MIEFEPLQKAVLTAEEACEYLGLDSKRSLERLVQEHRLIPIRIVKSNLYPRAELDEFITRELERERRLGGASD